MKTITNIIEKEYSGGSGLMRMIDESKGDKSTMEKGSSFFNKSQKKITSSKKDECNFKEWKSLEEL